jgi:epoxyqueuosine reductase QueG
MLGKVLTTAPFAATSETPKEPECGDCSICVDVCPTNALHGRTWSAMTTLNEIMTRKLFYQAASFFCSSENCTIVPRLMHIFLYQAPVR